jgi:alpha-N-arabinofuranosidase
MPTYAAWEYEVLEHCFDEVDYISLHQYFRNDDNDIAKFMSALDDLDGFIKSVAAIADSVAAKRRSSKRIMLSLDEWNVWYKAHGPSDLKKPGWPQAPALLDEIYNAEDALIVGGALIVLMNNADRVKVACLAQLVNVLGAIHTDHGGAAWRQTIFHPFALASRHAHGNSLRTKSDGPNVTTAAHGDVPVLMHSVVHDPDTGRATIFALNRSADESMALSVELRGAGNDVTLELATELHHHDLKAINDRDQPDRVAPAPNATAQVAGNRVTAELKPLSWNVIVVATR